MDPSSHLILPLLQAFCWFDDGLQSRLRAKGWHHVNRSQSMIMANVVMGVDRPAEIARNLGVSRQAVHATIDQMAKLGMLELREIDGDRRSKTVVMSARGLEMRHDALGAMEELMHVLRGRIGSEAVTALVAAFKMDWGEPEG